MQRSAGIGPAKRLTEDLVEIVDKIEHAGSQILERRKAGAFEQASREDGKPDLDLIEPGTMPWGVDKANAMRGILQEFAARLRRLQDAGLTFEPQVVLNASALGDPFDEVAARWAAKSASVRVGPRVALTILPVTTSKVAIKHKVPCR